MSEEEKPATPEFWGGPDDERLRNTEINDAIEDILDPLDSPLPAQIEVVGYDRMKPKPPKLEDWITEHVIESLDEEYGDPEGQFINDPDDDDFIEAARECIRKITDAYTSFACEEVTRETINVREWVEECRPDWITEDGITIEELEKWGV